MKTIQIPQMEDDLKFASESIQRIAMESIGAIERLYKLRFENNDFRINPLTVDNSRVQPMTIDDSRVAPLTVDNSRVQPMRSPAMDPIPPIQPTDRQPLVDHNLHNLAL